jgi:hypothetical protein
MGLAPRLKQGVTEGIMARPRLVLHIALLGAARVLLGCDGDSGPARSAEAGARDLPDQQRARILFDGAPGVGREYLMGDIPLRLGGDAGPAVLIGGTRVRVEVSLERFPQCGAQGDTRARVYDDQGNVTEFPLVSGRNEYWDGLMGEIELPDDGHWFGIALVKSGACDEEEPEPAADGQPNAFWMHLRPWRPVYIDFHVDLDPLVNGDPAQPAEKDDQGLVWALPRQGGVMAVYYDVKRLPDCGEEGQQRFLTFHVQYDDDDGTHDQQHGIYPGPDDGMFYSVIPEGATHGEIFFHSDIADAKGQPTHTCVPDLDPDVEKGPGFRFAIQD